MVHKQLLGRLGTVERPCEGRYMKHKRERMDRYNRSLVEDTEEWMKLCHKMTNWWKRWWMMIFSNQPHMVQTDLLLHQ